MTNEQLNTELNLLLWPEDPPDQFLPLICPIESGAFRNYSIRGFNGFFPLEREAQLGQASNWPTQKEVRSMAEILFPKAKRFSNRPHARSL
jgi:hypothetical protein